MNSMTGYGKAENSIDGITIVIEIKSVNGRYLDINFRMPAALNAQESHLRNRIKKQVRRGKLSVFIDIKQTIEDGGEALINEKRLAGYIKALNVIRRTFDISDPIQLSHVMAFPDIFEQDIEKRIDDNFLNILIQTLNQALDAFIKMRTKEGTHLKEDMASRIEHIQTLADRISEIAPANTRKDFEKLLNRSIDLIGAQKIDKERLEQEIALISDKVDISEECTRLQSHLIQFKKELQKGGELGKKLTFLLQEMHREANTMNSKTTNINVAHDVILIKEEIEKIREQAQNIE